MKAPLSSSLVVSVLAASGAVSAAYGQITEDLQLQATDAAASDRFGYSTAIHGDRIVVGARGEDTNGNTAGAAYVFDAVTGQQTLKLLAADGEPGDIFGNTVAINGDFVLVGADREDGNLGGTQFLTNSGTAYVFDATTGAQLFRLRANDELSGAHYSRDVALSGNLAAIGANAANAQFEEVGAVYIVDVSTGQEMLKFLTSDGSDDDFFGDNVDISGDLAVSGARGDDDNGTDSGSAYVFDAVTGAEVVKLLPSDGAERDLFGVAVAISGNRVVVGSRRDDDLGVDSGSAYVFDATTGQQLFKLLPSDGVANDNFGDHVAITDSLILVSASRDDDNGSDTGAVYVFDLATGQQLSKLLASDGGVQHFFGYGVSAEGTRVAMGSPFSDQAGSSSGSAYVFNLDTGGVMSFCDPAAPNSVSLTGGLLTSVSDFGTAQATFNVTNVPDGFGLLFAGDMTTSVALGCGTRCVGGMILRGPVMMASGNQVLGANFDMGQAGASHIQYWHRDSGPCGSGSNLTNALTQ